MADEDSVRPLLTMTHEGTSYDLFLDRFKLSEAEDCEAKTGWTVAEWLDALVQSRARAIKFALFLSMKRVGESPVWTDLDMDMSDVTWVEPDEEPATEAPAPLGATEDDPGPIGPGEQQPTLAD